MRRILRLREAIDASATPMPEVAAELVDALLQAGDRAGAVDIYRTFESRFPVHASRSAKLREAYERALWSVPAALPTNLPAARGPFVGRHSEMARIADEIERTRFVCLVGPGGIGKSRLALQAARMWIADFPDGVWWVNCAPAAGGDALLALVARVMRFEDRGYMLDSLLERIGTARAALILDCCEGLAAEIASFARAAIERCPRISVLTTSRVALDGANCFFVDAMNDDAVRLFVEFALGSDPNFAMTPQNAPLVEDIARSLNGVPLAIEIAAAYLAHADLSELHRRVTRRGYADLTQTLDRTIDWAYRFLRAEDALVLRAMSAFPEVWTLDDALAMGGTRESVERLAAASLVVRERGESGLTRYRMLDTTRAFMRARLDECGETGAVLARYMEHAVNVAHESKRSLERADGKAPLLLQDRYQTLAHAVDAGAGDTQHTPASLEIAGTIGIGLGMLGFAGDLRSRVHALLQTARRAGFNALPVFEDALRAAGWLANRSGEYREALQLNEELIERARTRDDRRALGRNLALAVVVYCNAGELERGHEAAKEGIAIARSQGDVQSLSVALRGLACVLLNLNRGAEAVEPMREFVCLPPDEIPKMQQAMGMCDYAEALHAATRLEDAAEWFQRAIDLCEQIHDRGSQTHAYANLATVHGKLGDIIGAHAAALQAVRLCKHNVNVLTKILAFEEAVASSIRDDQANDLAFLLGYVDAVRRRYGLKLTPEREPRSTSIREAVVQRLNRAQFNREFQNGAAASLDDAIDVAVRMREGNAPLERSGRFANLTRREREIAELAAAGHTNRAIAERLVLSVRTVDVHIASIFRKLGIDRRERILN